MIIVDSEPPPFLPLLVIKNYFFLNIIVYILEICSGIIQTPEIGQGLGRFLSCGARKQEQT